MFGFTKLTPEETIERDIKLRIRLLNARLIEETISRKNSLETSEELRDELESLLKK
jgi:hypothetical protein